MAQPKAAMQRLRAADGHVLDGWVAPAEGVARGGLVILQEIFGLTDQLKEVAADYAAAGYDVAIPALFDRQAQGMVLGFDDIAAARAAMMAAEPADVLRDIAAAVAALAPRRVAVLGFCWGGGLAFRCAQELDIAAAVSFYGTRLDQYLDRPAKTALQGHFGSLDTHTPPDVVARVQAQFPDIDLHLYDAGHAFANSHRPSAYDAAATALAHQRAKAFLSMHLE